MFERKVSIFLVAIILGFLIMAQSRSFEGANELLLRDNESNIFQEITILKKKNQDLEKEIQALEDSKSLLANQNSALEAIEEEIEKYRKLSGEHKIFGPGITITIDGDISTPWLIDLINELFSLGSEAVSVNGIRITNLTSGFDTLPHGQIFVSGTPLSSPFELSAIGESSLVMDALEVPGGIFDRIEGTFPGISLSVIKKDFIQMD